MRYVFPTHPVEKFGVHSHSWLERDDHYSYGIIIIAVQYRPCQKGGSDREVRKHVFQRSGPAEIVCLQVAAVDDDSPSSVALSGPSTKLLPQY